MSNQFIKHEMKLLFTKIESIYRGFLNLEKRRFEGSKVPHEVYVQPDVAAVLAVTEDGKVYVTVQPRVGRGVSNSIEIPAGRVEEGDTPEITARKELKQETGCEAGELIFLGAYFFDPACCTSKTYLYLARDAKQVGNLELDGGEVLEPYTISYDEFKHMITTGVICDGNSVLAYEKAREYLE